MPDRAASLAASPVSSRRRLVFWAALAITATVSIYGYWAEALDGAHLWTPTGAARFPKFSAAYWIPAALVIFAAPRWAFPFTIVACLAVAGWLAGPAPVLATAYFLGSCYWLGRRMLRGAPGDTPFASSSILMGSAIWMFLVWSALHFPLNRPWLYWTAFAIPYLISAPEIRPAVSRLLAWKPPETGRGRAAAQAVLIYILAAHLLVALGPEISSDGLSMHLKVATTVADTGAWGFDFERVIFAVMPLGADSLYAAGYLLGEGLDSLLGRGFSGEAAARLVNFSFLCLTVSLIYRIARRWLDPAQSLLAGALFASTPLVQLVTGSLLVENVWTALIAGPALSLLHYYDRHHDQDLILTGTLLGAAMAVKLIAVAYAVPLGLLALVEAVTWTRSRAIPRYRPVITAAALLMILAAPPYVYAFTKTGNPIFPFKNTLFQSPYYDTVADFDDPRFTTVDRSWKTPYELFYRSEKFIEGEPGAGGFQYLLLLLPAAVLIRRRTQAAVVFASIAGVGIILAGAPNLRYMYPSMALASIAAGWAIAAMPRVLGAGLLLALTGLNLWFLPAANWYHRDFALFRPSERAPAIENMAPMRRLIDWLNTNASGTPIALYETDQTAGLQAPAYDSGWHSEPYWSQVTGAATEEEVVQIWKDHGIEYVIAPEEQLTKFETSRRALQRWTDPMEIAYGLPVNRMALFRVRDTPLPRSQRPFAPGSYDDAHELLDYLGRWTHDNQFPESREQSLTYSAQSGDAVLLDFEGTGVRYIYTAAANRGIAEIRIDGELIERRNLYSAETQWQSAVTYDGLAAGQHSLEIRVTGEQDPAASGGFVDLDALEVIP